MSIPIYEAEKADNLAEQIKANASVAYIAQVDSHIPTKSEMDLAGIPDSGKVNLWDGRTGKKFDYPVFCGNISRTT